MSKHDDDVLERPPILQISEDPQEQDSDGISNAIVTFRGTDGKRSYDYTGKVQFRSISYLLSELAKRGMG